MTIFLDFNGTILDDLDLCINLLNEMLVEQGHTPVTKERYLDIFTFPIIEYYKAAGFTFENYTYEELAHRFINRYQPASFKCNLHEGIVETVKNLTAKGHQVIVLSASKHENLVEQLSQFNIVNIFNDILGIEDIYAQSKINLARCYVDKHKLNPKNIIMVGDTLHDGEVATELGCHMIYYTKGHQSKSKFIGFKTIDHFNELEKEIEIYEKREESLN